MESKFKEALLTSCLNELLTLPSEEELVVQHQFSAEFEQTIKRAVKYSHRNYVSIVGFTMRRSAVAAVLVIALLTGSMSVKAIREPFIAFLLKTYESFSHIIFTSDEETNSGDGDTEFAYLLPAPPTGYTMTSEQKLSGMYIVDFASEEGLVINYSQEKRDNLIMNIDTEDVETSSIMIEGMGGLKFSNKGTNTIILDSDEYVFVISGSCEFSVLETLAENIF